MPRTWQSLAHDWRFFRADAPDAQDPGFDASHWSVVSVPHTFNADDTCVANRFYYRGPAWYRCSLPHGGLPGPEQRVELVALGAFAVTNVWVNGQPAGEFMGGFTGFCVDISPFLKTDGENILALRVTNEHDPEVLPGKDIPDYDLYGGIYREIGLRVTDALRIADQGIELSTLASDEGGQAALRLRVRNDRACAANAVATATVFDPAGAIVAVAEVEVSAAAASESSFETELPVIVNPWLWSPDRPALYRLQVELRDVGGSIDVDERTFGFRRAEFDPDRGFLLNGMPLKLRGFNRHQDLPGLGSALPAAFQEYDVRLIKEMGGNFVRCSHYPMHPAFLDACDRLGVLVYEEIASWQHVGGERFARNAVAMMEEMIARDRHHPSIILWGLLNEGRDRALFESLNAAARRCDPTRLTIYAENHPEQAVELGTDRIPDVLGINYRTEDLDIVRRLLPGMPLLCSEHTNADVGRRGVVDKEALALFRIMHDIDEFDRREWMAGSALWCMHDYGTALDVTWPLHFSGCLDGWRLPKLAAIGIRARWSHEPVLHIVGHWNHTGLACGDAFMEPHLSWALKEIQRSGPPRPEAAAYFGDYQRPAGPVPVLVISNLSPVELFLNGQSLGVRTRDEGLLWSVPFEPGVLRAVGHGPAGEVVHELRTAANPDVTGTVRLETLHSELPANGTDVTLITATIVDRDGVPVLTASRAVSFRIYLDGVEGGAEVLGLGRVPGLVTQCGVGRIALRAGRKSGRLRIATDAVALREGETFVTLTPVE